MRNRRLALPSSILERAESGLTALLSDAGVHHESQELLYVLTWYSGATQALHRLASSWPFQTQSIWSDELFETAMSALTSYLGVEDAIPRLAATLMNSEDHQPHARGLPVELQQSDADRSDDTLNALEVLALPREGPDLARAAAYLFKALPERVEESPQRSLWQQWRESRGQLPVFTDDAHMEEPRAETSPHGLLVPLWKTLRHAREAANLTRMTVIPFQCYGLLHGAISVWERAPDYRMPAPGQTRSIVDRLSDASRRIGIFLHALAYEAGIEMLSQAHQDGLMEQAERFRRCVTAFAPSTTITRPSDLEVRRNARGPDKRDCMRLQIADVRIDVRRRRFPWDDDEEKNSVVAIRRAWELAGLSAEEWAKRVGTRRPRATPVNFKTLGDVVSKSPSPVLVLGGSGTGKDHVARFLYRTSPFVRGKYVPVNCAALSSSVALSELVGSVKGAYTSGDTHRPGAFLVAAGADVHDDTHKKIRTPTDQFIQRFGLREPSDGPFAGFYTLSNPQPGLLFLDEIADLPDEAQGSLLRVLDRTGFRPLGWEAAYSIRVDFRLVCATRNRERLLNAKTFRTDLLARLDTWIVRTVERASEDVPTGMVATQARIEELNAESEEESGGAVPKAILSRAGYEALMIRIHDGVFDGSEGGNLRGIRSAIERAWTLACSEHSGDGQRKITARHIGWACDARWSLQSLPTETTPVQDVTSPVAGEAERCGLLLARLAPTDAEGHKRRIVEAVAAEFGQPRRELGMVLDSAKPPYHLRRCLTWADPREWKPGADGYENFLRLLQSLATVPVDVLGPIFGMNKERLKVVAREQHGIELLGPRKAARRRARADKASGGSA